MKFMAEQDSNRSFNAMLLLEDDAANFITLQAAMVLSFVSKDSPNYITPDFDNERRIDVININKYFDWMNHGHVNMVFSGVGFLEAFVKHCASTQKHFAGIWLSEASIICDALIAAQRWKNESRECQKKRDGANFGSATGWARRDVTNNLAEFVKLYKLSIIPDLPIGTVG